MPRTLGLSVLVLIVVSVASAIVGATAGNPDRADAGWMVFACSMTLAVFLAVVGSMTERRTGAT